MNDRLFFIHFFASTYKIEYESVFTYVTIAEGEENYPYILYNYGGYSIF